MVVLSGVGSSILGYSLRTPSCSLQMYSFSLTKPANDRMTYIDLSPGQRHRMTSRLDYNGPGAVVKAACLESRMSLGSNRILAYKFQRNKMFLLRVNIQYCGEPT